MIQYLYFAHDMTKKNIDLQWCSGHTDKARSAQQTAHGRYDVRAYF